MLYPVTDDVIARLKGALGETAVRPVEQRYLEEPRGRWAGQGGVVVAPDSTDGVARAVRIAREARVPVIPYGGGTGLVGGQVYPEGPAPMILSLERMARIRAVYPEEGVLVAEAGATLAAVQAAAQEAGRLFPLSYASEGTARIGGALSVNSGGINVLRYGTARELALGIEAVLPSGDVLHGLKRLRKDNTGYDLRHLLIGAEGTLGVITAASLRLAPRPARIATALLAIAGPEAALTLYAETQARADGTVSAFEIIAGEGFDFLDEAGLAYHRPFADAPAWSVLVELGTGPAQDPEALLEDLFEWAHGAGLVSDGVIASSETRRADLWHIRETIPEANRLVGAIASHDISLPLSELAGFVAETGPALRALAPVRINAFGHLGDGNLHYNLFPPPHRNARDFDNVRAELSRLVYDGVTARGGSISAEHGVGRLKPADIVRYGDPARIAAMRAIKAALDPLGIMNPGAVLEPS